MDPTMTRRDALRGTGSLLAGVAVAGCSSDGGEGNIVDMTDNLVFDPETLTVSVGEAVTWENVGTVAHTVTAYDDQIPSGATYFASGGADSEEGARDAYGSGGEGDGLLEEGETYEHTFDTPGTYDYFCIPHEASMTGTIEVQDG